MFVFFSRKKIPLGKGSLDKKPKLTMLLSFFAKIGHFSSQRLKKFEGHYFSIENIFSLNKFIWTQWYTFHEFAGKFRQNITNFRSSCQNVFAIDSLPGKKTAKSSLEAWNPAMTRVLIFSGQKSNFLISSKICAHFLRENTKLLKKVSEKKQSPWKNFLETDQTRFWQSVGDSSPKYDNSLLKSRKKFKKWLFSKPSIVNRDAFLINMPNKFYNRK